MKTEAVKTFEFRLRELLAIEHAATKAGGFTEAGASLRTAAERATRVFMAMHAPWDSAEIVNPKTGTGIRVIMRPPLKGERAWWASVHDGAVLICKQIVATFNPSTASAVWIAKEDFSEADRSVSARGDSVAVTVELVS